MHFLTLSFHDNALEKAFLGATISKTRQQGQFACLVGMFVYVLHGALDHWFVPPELAAQIWLLRGIALCVPTAVLMLSLTPWFNHVAHALLALVGAAAGSGLLAMQMLLPIDSVPYYYPMMVLVTFYTYNFVGTRFIYALCVDLALLFAYNLLFAGLLAYPLHIMLSHNFFFVSANLIGGSAGYLAERQRRLLFLREQELDAERRHHQQRSLHDGLTGLPNRELLYDRITHAQKAALRNGTLCCGYFLDLDGFKGINDTLGHRFGDQALGEVAKRLLAAVRASDTVARIGGDEFFVLAEDIGNEQAARALARKVLQEISAAQLAFPPGSPRLGVSMGLCLFPYDEMSVVDLLRRADAAMYQVKASGKGGYAVADPIAPKAEPAGVESQG